jgi:NitT/TauT family transport system substrate-binding protein
MFFHHRLPFAIAALLLAVASGPSATVAQSPPLVVRLASSAAETYAQALYAQDLGLYQKAGLTAEVNILATGAAVSTAVVGGAADVGISTTLNLANAISRGVPLVVIAPGPMTTVKSPSGLICVAKSSRYKTAKDFEGETIAVPALKQTADLGVREWLTRGGVDPAKVHIIEAPFATMAAAVERGTYAAAAISEPALNIAMKSGAIRCIGDPFGAIAPNYMFAAWFTTKPFAEKNPDVVRKVAQVLTDAAKWANTHHTESAAIVARINKLNVETIRSETRPVYAEEIRVSEIQPQLDAGYKYGFLTRPVTASELLGH